MTNYDVAVIGGGSAGMAAAAAAAGNGARTVLFDENPAFGGQLRYRNIEVTHGEQTVPATELAGMLAEQVRSAGSVLAPSSIVWGLYPGFVLAVAGSSISGEVRASRVIIASGETDLAMAFPGSDLPGVMTGRGLLRMLHLHRVWPGGKRVAVVGDDQAMAREVAHAIEHAGGTVMARLEGRPIVHARDGVAAGIQTGREAAMIETDLVAICAGMQPDNSLGLMLECETGYSEALGGFVPRRSNTLETSVPGVFVCGGAAGRGSIEVHRAEGTAAGLAAAASLGLIGEDAAIEAIEAFAALDPARLAAIDAVEFAWKQHTVEAVRAGDTSQ